MTSDRSPSESEKAQESGTDLLRIACKMATGSGKTVVMSMLIAWQVLNKRRYPEEKPECMLSCAGSASAEMSARLTIACQSN